MRLRQNSPAGWTGVLRVLSRLRADTGGSLLPMIALGMMMLSGMAGLAVDGVRIFYVKDVLQKSLDAAGLAAGRSFSPNAMRQNAETIFHANFNSSGRIARIGRVNVRFSPGNRNIEVSADATVATTFMALFGIDEVTFSASTEIFRSTRGIELVLVMDNTGSMRAGGRMDAMKQAARDLVNIVYDNEDYQDNLWVGVVPYTATVNIGNGTPRRQWLVQPGDGDDIVRLLALDGTYAPTIWKGCVLAREDGEDETDTPPAEAAFDPFLYEDADDNNWIRGSDGASIYDLDERNEAQNDGRGPNLGCGPAITPLNASRQRILSAIDEMLPWHRGGTTSNLGLAWGWRVISPRWRGLWGSGTPSNLPLAYDTAFMEKVVVILTDGQNQFFDWRGHDENGGVGPGGSDYTAYGRLETFGFSNRNAARAEIDRRFARICTAMKRQDITVFTITFGASTDSETRRLYEDCASDPGFYFDAPSTETLQDSFIRIGEELAELRVSR